jgi:Protein of unknown function (DUF2911)
MPRRAWISLEGLLVASFLAVGCAFGHGNDQGKTEATIGKAKVSIEYGRPMLKDRDINKMIQPGQMWRIGADIPTVIESDADLNFGGIRVPKGKHVLLARLVTPGQWSLVVSSAAINHYEPSSKLAEVPLKLEQEKDPVNELTIRLSNEGGQGVIEISWGTARLLGSFEPAS